MATSQPRVPSQHGTLEYLRLQYDNAIASGVKRRLLFPQMLFSMALLAGFLLIDHRRNRFLYQLRWLVWFTIIAVEVSNMRHRISVDPAVSYVSGIASVYVIVWSTMWLIFERPQFTAVRIERRRKAVQNGIRAGSGGTTQERSETIGYKMNGNGYSLEQQNGLDAEKSLAATNDSKGEWEYFWQPYPDVLGERLAWVLDLIFSFRGRGWNFSIPTNPALPEDVAASLGEPISESDKVLKSRTGIKCFRTRKELASYVISRFILCYLVLDLCKFQIIHDPFFRTGDESLPAPPYLDGLPPFLITRIRRNTLVLSLVTFIQFHALLVPIIASLLLSPTVLGIRGEPWMYATTWGSPSTILDKGLGGFWSSWWHQTFRAGFTAPTNYLIRKGWLPGTGIASQLVGIAIAFIISGAMHTAGSAVQVLPTHPERQLTFFLLQLVAVTAQTSFCAALRPWIERLPVWARRTGNAVFTYLWLYATCPLFMNDMSAGGTWMYEPVMGSPLRWWGLGPKGYGWWTWAHVEIGWYQGRHWWESGIGGL
ncbi:hypothetical protein VE01_03399 [Pseudogymnoascus verrucosus]|uniref:Wax synthase domain-containing protein n=1 Tax=Pseudogymnoascus verrucosus TaxID=342668 RepID=A0A1B8GS90_9PEZI|nr:uncharacterized protein VE01_03399 [Pseudogymnoascus verrucosus]OBT98670.1 hypothetical protein VE01_03399 [Pseudogymnoascus verrucosus]